MRMRSSSFTRLRRKRRYVIVALALSAVCLTLWHATNIAQVREYDLDAGWAKYISTCSPALSRMQDDVIYSSEGTAQKLQSTGMTNMLLKVPGNCVQTKATHTHQTTYNEHMQMFVKHA